MKRQASTVSRTDCAIRNGSWSSEFGVSPPATPGVDVVGKIFRIDEESSANYKLNVGDRVMSLVKCGGNSRYLTVDPAKLVKVSDQLDPAEAVCLVEIYLYAFQLSHSGQSKAARYRKNSLQGKRILIVGKMTSSMGKAILKLCGLAGCRHLLATVADKDFDEVVAMGATPIDPEPSNWKHFLNGSVDLIILLAGRISETVANDVLRPMGIMVVATSYSKADGLLLTSTSPSRKMGACARPMSFDSRLSRYNVFRAWDDNREYIQDDLRHLATLLEERKLVPEVLDRVSLANVGKAHALLESKRQPGFIVCEPWLVSKSKTLNL